MQTLTPGSILGHAVRRREDERLVTGAGHYVGDRRPAGSLFVAFVRSPLAHAKINSVDRSAASMPGVVAFFTATDLKLPSRVGFEMVPPAFARPRLADGVVRFVGEPVAVVVAESREAAADAAQSVELDLEPLKVLADAATASHASSPHLFAKHDSNVAGHFASGTDQDPLEGAEVTVRARFVNQRLAPVPMEPEAIVATPDGDRLTVWATSQQPNEPIKPGHPGGRDRTRPPAGSLTG